MEMSQVKRWALLIVGMFPILGLGQTARGTIYFQDGVYHKIDYSINDYVVVRNSPLDQPTTITTLTYIWYSLDIYGTSLAYVSAGYIHWDLTTHEYGQAIMSGGRIYNGGAYAYGNSQLTISGGRISKGNVDVFDDSQLTISGGVIGQYWSGEPILGHVYAWHNSQVTISGGSMYQLHARHTSTVDMSGGTIDSVEASQAATVDISGGIVLRDLTVHDTSIVDVSGGAVNHLYAHDTSAVSFSARDFRLGGGLSFDGDRVLGTGILSGEWFDGTPWAVNIEHHDSGATILAVPEPASIALLALGGLAVMRRKRST